MASSKFKRFFISLFEFSICEANSFKFLCEQKRKGPPNGGLRKKSHNLECEVNFGGWQSSKFGTLHRSSNERVLRKQKDNSVAGKGCRISWRRRQAKTLVQKGGWAFLLRKMQIASMSVGYRRE